MIVERVYFQKPFELQLRNFVLFFCKSPISKKFAPEIMFFLRKIYLRQCSIQYLLCVLVNYKTKLTPKDLISASFDFAIRWLTLFWPMKIFFSFGLFFIRIIKLDKLLSVIVFMFKFYVLYVLFLHKA